MENQRTEYIQADDYERSESRQSQRMAIMSETLRLVWVHSN